MAAPIFGAGEKAITYHSFYTFFPDIPSDSRCIRIKRFRCGFRLAAVLAHIRSFFVDTY